MNLKKILETIVKFGVFLIPFIPLIVTIGFFFPFITGKNFAFRIIVELLFASWAILAFWDAKYRPKFSLLLTSIVVFVSIIAVADLFGENPFRSFWSNFERMDGLLTLIHLLMYFVVATTVIRTENLWKRFLQTSVGVSVVISVFGILQLAGVLTINQGGTRLDATFGNATYLAVYMLFHVFITALIMVKWKKHIPLYSGIILLQTIILFFTGTRGTILGFLGGIFVTSALIVLFGQNKTFKKVALGFFAGLIILIGGFIAIKDSNFIQDNYFLGRFADISLEEGSARFQIWNMAYQGFKEKPLLGWGQENFNYVFNKYYDASMYAQEQWFDRVHNIIFDWLIAGGILGLLSYLLIFFTTLYYLWIRKRDAFSVAERSIITGLLTGYFFHNLLVFDNLTSYILFFTILAYVNFHGVGNKETGKISSDQTVKIIVVPIVIIVTAFSMYFFTIRGIESTRTLIKSISPQEEGVTKNLEYFNKALTYDVTGRQEVREQLLQISTTLSRTALDIETKQAFLTLATNSMQDEIGRNLNDARLYILMGSALMKHGFYEEAFPYLNRALELSPKKQQILFTIGEYYINIGQNDKALEIFKMAFESAPEYDDARILYALGAVYTKKYALIEEILIPRYGTVAIDDDRLLNAYVENRLVNQVLEIWKIRVEKNPNDVQTRLSLATAYLQLNQRQNAIKEIQKVVELDPSLKEEAEKYISNIQAGKGL